MVPKINIEAINSSFALFAIKIVLPFLFSLKISGNLFSFILKEKTTNSQQHSAHHAVASPTARSCFVNVASTVD
jgi:hypothetical protein